MSPHHQPPSSTGILGQLRDAWSAMPFIVRAAIVVFAAMYAIGALVRL